MSARLWAILAAAVVVGLLIANCVFIVDQRVQVVVVNLGEPVRTINAANRLDPGLKFKAPWEQVVMLDKRNQALVSEKEEITTDDRVRLVVDAFMRYRITDPLRFYRTLHDERIANDRLKPLFDSSLRQAIGAATSSDVISKRRSALMMQTLQDLRTRTTAAKFGIEVIDVRITRADFPTDNEHAVFKQMESNLAQQAAKTRAIGAQQALEITADADKQVQITLAGANQEASTIRGDGDAQRAAIFAASFGRDPSFAAYYRSLQAYQVALADGATTIVLSPDSEFFKYFKKGPNGR